MQNPVYTEDPVLERIFFFLKIYRDSTTRLQFIAAT